MGASPKKDIKLSDDSTVTIDVSTLKRKEWTDFWKNTGAENETVFVAKFCSLSKEQIDDLLNDDYRRIFDAMVTLINRPLDNPNSPSAST